MGVTIAREDPDTETARGLIRSEILPLLRRLHPGADANLLATTFNTLTESIARFQREATQRERLSSLGRLSTVIAHEIRNPLMIIRAALRSLRHPDAAPNPRARSCQVPLQTG